MSENTGTFCDNFHYYKHKVDRITKSLKMFQKDPNMIFLNSEIEIFLQDLKLLPPVIQECADRMEQGLQKRKKFLESKGLEQEYQNFKNNLLCLSMKF